jgi:hypothetical protein
MRFGICKLFKQQDPTHSVNGGTFQFQAKGQEIFNPKNLFRKEMVPHLAQKEHIQIMELGLHICKRRKELFVGRVRVKDQTHDPMHLRNQDFKDPHAVPVIQRIKDGELVRQQSIRCVHVNLVDPSGFNNTQHGPVVL